MTDARPIPLLTGRRVYLRASERADIELFVRWFNDQRVTRFLSMNSPMSVAAEERWFDRMLEAQGRDSFHFVICLAGDGQAIGTIGLFDVDRTNGSAGIGISIGDPACWSQGLGTEAMDILLDFGFGELRLERLWLHVYDYNTRARRSYEKSGFTLEGTMRHAIFKRGRHHDVHLMAILRHEWAAQERARTWDASESDPRI